MDASLLALLSQQNSNLQTRKGLILLGLQNDFLSPDGKLHGSTESGFLERIKETVPAFREFGDVIWVRSEFESNRVANLDDEHGDTVIAGNAAHTCQSPADCTGCKASNNVSARMRRMQATEAEDDEELFLTRTPGREPCCVKDSWGAKHPADIEALIHGKDLQVTKTYYSAFGSTSLLLTLRSRLITELYVCGCNTNLSVFATAMDAARYGIKITVIEDCLGHRVRERHDEALRQLVDIMGAEVLTSRRALEILKNPELAEVDESDDDYDDEDEEGNEDKHEQGGAHKHINVQADANNTSARLHDLLVADSDDDEDEEEEISIDQIRQQLLKRSRQSSPPSIGNVDYTKSAASLPGQNEVQVAATEASKIPSASKPMSCGTRLAA